MNKVIISADPEAPIGILVRGCVSILIHEGVLPIDARDIAVKYFYKMIFVLYSDIPGEAGVLRLNVDRQKLLAPDQSDSVVFTLMDPCDSTAVYERLGVQEGLESTFALRIEVDGVAKGEAALPRDGQKAFGENFWAGMCQNSSALKVSTTRTARHM